MQNKGRRLLALLLSTAMIVSHVPAAIYGQEASTETVVAAEETQPVEMTEAQTKAPEPVTEAPAETEPQTQAPVETVPATEAQTQPPQTDAPAQAPVETVPATQAQPPKETAPQTEAETKPASAAGEESEETEPETKATTDTFTGKAGQARITVKLSGKERLPEDTKVLISEYSHSNHTSEYQTYVSRLRNLTDSGRLALSDALLYQVKLESEGKQVKLSGDVQISVRFGSGVSLGLEKGRMATAGVYTLGEKASRVGDVSLGDSLTVTGFSFSTRGLPIFGVAGVQIADPAGAAITGAQLSGKLSVFNDHVLVAGKITGNKKLRKADGVLCAAYLEKLEAKAARENETEGGKEDQTEEDQSEIPQETAQEAASMSEQENEAGKTYTSEDVWGALDDLGALSLELASSGSSSDVLVLNCYADEQGVIDTAQAAKAAGQGSSYVVVNIAAAREDQSLQIPALGIGSAAGVIYNLFTWNVKDDAPTAYVGSAAVPAGLAGVVLAPAGTLDMKGSFAGSAGAQLIEAGRQTKINASSQETEAISESETEEPTETLSESEEAATEALTESEVDPSELGSELETETQEEMDPVLAAEDPDTVTIYISAEQSAPAGEQLKDASFTLVYEAGGEEHGVETAPAALVSDGSALLQVAVTISDTANSDLKTLLETSTAEPKRVEIRVKAPETVTSDGIVWNLGAASNAQVSLFVTKQTGAQEGDEDRLQVQFAGEEETPVDEAHPVRFQYVPSALTYTVNPLRGGRQPLAGTDYTVAAGDLADAVTLGDADAKQSRTLTIDVAKVQEAIAKAQQAQGKEEGEPFDPVAPFTITVTQTTTPPLYSLTSDKSVSITVTPDDTTPFGFTIAPEAGSGFDFVHEINKKALSVTVHSVDEKGKDLSGAEFSAAAGADQLTVSGSGASFKVAIADWSDLDAFSALAENPTKTATATITVQERSVPENYTLTSAASQTVTVSYDGKGNFSVAPAALTFAHKEIPTTGTLLITLTNAAGKAKNGTFVIKNSAGRVLTTLHTTNGKVKLTQKDYDFLAKAGTYTVTQTGFPEDHVTAAGSLVSQSITVKAHQDNDLEVDFVNDTGTASETIRITKRLYVGNSSMSNYGMIYSATEDTELYVALYADANRRQRISDFYPLTVESGHPYKVLTIAHIPAGTYYLGESYAAQDGTLVPTSKARASEYWVTYGTAAGEDARGKVTLKGSSGTHSLSLTNRYLEIPEDYSYLAPVGIRKIVHTREDVVDTAFNGKVRLRAAYGQVAQTLSLQVNNGQSSTGYFYIPLGNTGAAREVRFSELTEQKSSIANTAVLANGKSYKVSIDKPTITVKRGEAIQTVTVTNTEVDTEKESESEELDENAQAELTLTKKVTYKNTPIRVNSVYYIGIFDDAGLKKLRYKKAMQFKNASEMSATLKINLYKLKSKEVTFYFAEVDRNGKVVDSGTSTGYEISQNKKSITLNAKNMKDELIITNSVVQGSRRERQLTDPTSGFAGDSAALAEAQQLENDENAGINTTTGDKTPLVPWSAALVLSAAVLTGGVMWRRKRYF